MTSLRTIDYDAVLQELTKTRVMKGESPHYRVYQLSQYLREERTAIIGNGRQTGKTKWLLSLHDRCVNSCVIAPNLTFKRNFERKEGRRVFTSIDILQMLESDNGVEELPTFDLVLIDEFYMVSRTISPHKLYEWIASNGHDQTDIVATTSF